MACPKSKDCPLYEGREDWCNKKGIDCLIYDAWYKAKAFITAMEEAKNLRSSQ